MSANKKTAFEVVRNLDLAGKTFLITGGYSGLGAASAKALLKAKAKVIIVGRNAETQKKFVADLLNDQSLAISAEQIDASQTMDLTDLKSVQAFSNYILNNYPQLDCLMNNAGIMMTPYGKSKDGFEIQMAANVMGHFLLTKNLIGITKRQVWLSSSGHERQGSPRIDIEGIEDVDEKNYNPQYRYQQSKLGDILLAKQFGIEYPQIKAVSVHPGLNVTNLSNHIPMYKKIPFMIYLLFKGLRPQSPEQGASTQVLAATMPESELVNGAYYADNKVSNETASAKNMEDAKKLFDYCNQVTKKFQ